MLKTFEYGSDNVRASTPAINLTDQNWIISVTFDPTNAALATADKRTNRCGSGSLAMSTSTGQLYRKSTSGVWLKISDSSDLSSVLTPGIGIDWWGAESAVPSGWILAWGTIGSASSGASNRANADTQSLFNRLWADFSDANLPVLTSAGGASTRGSSAAVDWAANKRISVPDKRGRVSVGKDDMGGTAANRAQLTMSLTVSSPSSTGTVASTVGLCVGMTITNAALVPVGTTITAITGATTFSMSNPASAITTQSARFSMIGDAQALGSVGGEQSHQIVAREIASHNHGGATGNQSDQGLHDSSANRVVHIGGATAGYGVLDSNTATSSGTLLENVHTHNIGLHAGDDSHNNVQPSIICNYIIKL